ncbi:MAG: hypothetical protein HYW70_03500 [Candidatus Nealsonbacteria bacterium]|nr:hypothetical protein [Candidatus Nealsonbacteria bacterium]
MINKILSVKVCPVCAGVSLSWVLILAGIYSGFLDYENWQTAAALLMGGTVAGVAMRAGRSLLWKSAVIVFGMSLAYIGLKNISLVTVAGSIIVLLVLGYVLFFRQKSGSNLKTVEELKEKLKKCC